MRRLTALQSFWIGHKVVRNPQLIHASNPEHKTATAERPRYDRP